MKGSKPTNDDNWTEEATDHDALVVDMLLQLKYSTTTTRPSAVKLVANANLGWGVKQPRSGTVVSGSTSKRSSRCSPSTPLSWSGGSGGTGVEGCEASSLLKNRSPISRSKINLDGGGVNGASSCKLIRQKKTYGELIDEEEILLRESVHLNQELVMMGGTVSEQRVKKENLKRIKRNVITKLNNNICKATGASGSRDAASKQTDKVMKAEVYDCVPSTSSQCRKPSSKTCKAECEASPAHKIAKFLLPDLNMMPPELDPTS